MVFKSVTADMETLLFIALALALIELDQLDQAGLHCRRVLELDRQRLGQRARRQRRQRQRNQHCERATPSACISPEICASRR